MSNPFDYRPGAPHTSKRLLQVCALIFVWQTRQVAEYVAAIVLGGRVGERHGVGRVEAQRLVVGRRRFPQARSPLLLSVA